MAHEQEHTPEDQTHNAAQTPAMTTGGPQVGPRPPMPVTFQQAKTAFDTKDASLGMANPEGVLALQQASREGARAKWQAKREEFERKVAIRATKDPKVGDAVDTMCQKAVDMILKMNGDIKSQQDAIAALGGGKYTPKDERPSFEQVVKMMKSGSIREKMNLLGTFQETMGKQMLDLGPEGMKKQMDKASSEKKANEEKMKAEGKEGPTSLNTQDVTAQRKDEAGKPVAAAEFGDKEIGKLAARADAVKADAAAASVASGKTVTPSAAGMFKPTKAEEAGQHATYAKAKSENHDTKIPMMSVAGVNALRTQNAASATPNPAVSALAPAQQGTQKDKEGKPIAPAGATDAMEASSIVKSEKKVSEFASDPTQDPSSEENKYKLDLSEAEREKAAANAVKEGKGEGDATLPWIEGQKANILDSSKEFIKDAQADSMPLKSGISGTTFRFMQTADILGVDADAAKMACVGMLQPLEAHSFHEIATAAGGFSSKDEKTGKESTGQSYGKTGEDGKKNAAYSGDTMAPLKQADLEEVAADCGTTLAYLNNPPPDKEPDGTAAPAAQQTAATTPPPPPAGTAEPPK